MMEFEPGEDIFAPEPLHPDLETHVHHVVGLGRCLQHPYVYSVPYHEPLNKQLNRLYAQKLERVEEALAAGNWTRYVYLHERPYRVNALMNIHERMTGAEYWAQLAATWRDSENIRQCHRLWMTLWHNARPGRAEHVMDDEERAAFAAMPDPLVIFRGTGNRAGIKGLSWTLDPAIARRLGSRYGSGTGDPNMIVARGVVQKHRVLAYFGWEDEIVVMPSHVRAITTMVYPRKRSQ